MNEIPWNKPNREQEKVLRARRTDAEMRTGIQDLLNRRAMSTHELKVSMGTSWDCLVRHLRWLSHIGVVVSYETVFEGKRIKLWRANK